LKIVRNAFRSKNLPLKCSKITIAKRRAIDCAPFAETAPLFLVEAPRDGLAAGGRSSLLARPSGDASEEGRRFSVACRKRGASRSILCAFFAVIFRRRLRRFSNALRWLFFGPRRVRFSTPPRCCFSGFRRVRFSTPPRCCFSGFRRGLFFGKINRKKALALFVAAMRLFSP